MADVSAIGLVLLPDAVMVTASCEFVQGDKHVTLKHVPISVAQSPALLGGGGAAHCRPLGWQVQGGHFGRAPRSFQKSADRGLGDSKSVRCRPEGKVLARELCGPWVHRFETRPAAVGDMINGLPKVQEHLPEFGIDALQHAQICRHLLAWAADVGSPLDLKRTVARQRPMQNVADLA